MDGKTPSSQVGQSLAQKKYIVERIDEVAKINATKRTRKQLETSATKTVPKATKFHELSSCTADTHSTTHQHLIKERIQIRSKPCSRSLHAPTISSTLRLIASRDAKKATTRSFQGVGAETTTCNLKKNSSSIPKAIPSVCSTSISVPNRKNTTPITKRFSPSPNRMLAGPLTTKLSTSNTPNSSRIINKSKINGHLGMLKPQEHSRRGATREFQARGNPGSSLDRSVVAPVSFSKSLDSVSFSRSQNSSKRGASGRPTSCHGQGRVLSLNRGSENAVAYSFNYHDQYREMRMNIDSMTYEELLELQEKIGSVSTGLTDDALTKCLKRSNYKLASSPSDISGLFDGNGCSICQEECDDGDEIGALVCEHWYHVICIQQWLRWKNSCPICKAPASVGNQIYC